MVKHGYSLSEIEQMDEDRYDYIVAYLMEAQQKGGSNPLEGGL